MIKIVLKRKKKFTGLGKSGFGKVLRRRKRESISSLVKRQEKEFRI